MTASAAPSDRLFPPRLLRYVVTVIAVTVPVAVGAALTQSHPRPPRTPWRRFRLCARRARRRVQAGAARRAGRPQGLAGVRLPARRSGPVRLAVRRDRRARRHRDRRGTSSAASRCAARSTRPAYALSAFASACPRSCSAGTAARSARRRRQAEVLAFAGGAAYVVTNVVLVAIAVALAQGCRCGGRRASTCATRARPSPSWPSSRRWPCRCGRSIRRSSCCSPAPSSRSRSTCATPTGPCSPCATPRPTPSPALGNHRSFQIDLRERARDRAPRRTASCRSR